MQRTTVMLSTVWLGLVPWLLGPAAAQDLVYRHAVAGARTVVPLPPATAVFQLEDRLVWQREGRLVSRPLPGRILQVTPGHRRRHLGVLVQPPPPDAAVRLQVYDEAGHLRADVAWPHEPDVPFPVMAVEEATGRFVAGQPATSEVVVYDAAGREQTRQRVFPEAEFDPEKSMALAWLPGQDAFVVAALRRAVAPQGRPADHLQVVCYSAEGQERWRFVPALPDLQAMTVLADGDAVFIAVATYDAYAAGGPVFQTQVLTPAGMERWRVPDGFERAAFHAESRTLLLVTRRSAAVHDLGTGALRYRFVPEDAAALMLDATLSSNGEEALLMLSRSRLAPDGFRYEGAEAVQLDAAGQVVHRWQMPHDAAHPPALVRLDAAGWPGAVTSGATYRLAWRP